MLARYVGMEVGTGTRFKFIRHFAWIVLSFDCSFRILYNIENHVAVPYPEFPTSLD